MNERLDTRSPRAEWRARRRDRRQRWDRRFLVLVNITILLVPIVIGLFLVVRLIKLFWSF
jgi:hypothetical protein